jgi:hypothetical protein
MEGDQVLIDTADFPKISKYQFFLNSTGYPVTVINNTRVNLHNLLIPSVQGYQIDHINRNKLDNRRSNLRQVSTALNQLNKGKCAGSKTSKYKGVSYAKDKNRYRAVFKKEHLGYFNTEEEAARAYNQRVTSLYGTDVYLNPLD